MTYAILCSSLWRNYVSQNRFDWEVIRFVEGVQLCRIRWKEKLVGMPLCLRDLEKGFGAGTKKWRDEVMWLRESGSYLKGYDDPRTYQEEIITRIQSMGVYA